MSESDSGLQPGLDIRKWSGRYLHSPHPCHSLSSSSQFKQRSSVMIGLQWYNDNDHNCHHYHDESEFGIWRLSRQRFALASSDSRFRDNHRLDSNGDQILVIRFRILTIGTIITIFTVIIRFGIINYHLLWCHCHCHQPDSNAIRDQIEVLCQRYHIRFWEIHFFCILYFWCKVWGALSWSKQDQI